MKSSIALSVFCVVVLLPFFCGAQNSQNSSTNQLKVDSDIAHLQVDIRGNVYFTKGNGETVTKWDTNGKLTLSGGNSSSAGRGKLGTVSDMAVTNGLLIYLADKRNFAVQILEKHLEWVGSLKPAIEELQYSEPDVVAVSPQEDVFVYYSDNRRLLKFNADGNLEPGFRLPVDVSHQIIDINATNNAVYLLDSKGVIHLLSPNGRYQRFIKTESRGGQLARYFDRLLYITGDRVYVISENGTFVAQWLIRDPSITQFNINNGWAVWRKGNILRREKMAESGTLSVLSRIE